METFNIENPTKASACKLDLKLTNTNGLIQRERNNGNT